MMGFALRKLFLASLLAVLAFAKPALADGPLPEQLNGKNKQDQRAIILDPKPLRVKKFSPLPADATAITYQDPRKRFTLRHDANWKAMPDWVGGIALFCLIPECKKSSMTSCHLVLMDADDMTQKDLERVSGIFEAVQPKEGYDVGMLGTVRFLPDASAIEIGPIRWVKSGIGMKLFDSIPLQTQSWSAVADGRLHVLQCDGEQKIMPILVPMVDELLRGFALTKP
jgi:hypothetical protein